MENIWKDTTTYSRGDKERKPSEWTWEKGKLKITVLTGHMYYPNRWLLICPMAGMPQSVLKAPIETPLEEIQAAAIRIVRKRLLEYIETLNA